MKQKRIILGSGYAAVGYALTRGETMIVEESEHLDTAFCLPLRSFSYPEAEPKTELGQELLRIWKTLGIIKGELVNTGALEIGLASLALDKRLCPMLKCRVTEIKDRAVELYSNSGFSSVEAEIIHDARTWDVTPDRLTLLYEAKDDQCEASLLSTFPGASIERTFYDGRYAIHIPIDPKREPNALRAELAGRWEESIRGAKIVMIAPKLAASLPSKRPSASSLCDLAYRSPLEALEGGVAFALEEMQKEGIR